MRYVNYFLLFCLFLLSSCAVGPNYIRPEVTTPTAYKEDKKTPQADAWKIAKPNDHINRGEWWLVFQDKKLNALENQLNHSNQTIINANANYQQALALVSETRSSFFPTLSTTATSTRQQQQNNKSRNTNEFDVNSGGQVNLTSADTTPFTSNALLFNASWEPDIWGSVRRNVEASTAGAEASAALLAVTRLSTQATLAQYYFSLRGLDSDQKLLDDIVAAYKQALSLTQHRYQFGVAGQLDVLQAQSQYDSARATAFNNHIARAQYEHAIAVLIGVPPEHFSITPEYYAATPPYIPAEIPSELLQRRPDIAQAERLMQQANAQIGVAISAYFPNLILSGSASSQSIGSIGHWLQDAAYGWSVGPQLAATLFDGGLRRATTQAARANYDASVANYRQVVLTAFQDVEDQLVAQRLLKLQSAAETKAAVNAKRALDIILNEYKAGTVAYTDVLVAQNTAYTAEKNAIDVAYLRMNTAVGLIKALGGGW